MVLGNKKIKEKQMIEPFIESQLQPASYDLSIDSVKGSNDKGIIRAGEYCLISTKEKVNLDYKTAAFVKTRSSLARRGLSVDFAGWVDPGFKGNLTLLMVNFGNEDFDLKTIDTFGQIIFMEVDGADYEYDGHYQNSEGLVESVI